MLSGDSPISHRLMLGAAGIVVAFSLWFSGVLSNEVSPPGKSKKLLCSLQGIVDVNGQVPDLRSGISIQQLALMKSGCDMCPGGIRCTQSKVWRSFQSELSRNARIAKNVDLLLLGDSITEAWRGTSRGMHCSRCKGLPAAFTAFRHHRIRALPLGISGDTTTNLLWRLREDGGQEGVAVRRSNPCVVILIGTNDLSLHTEYAVRKVRNDAAWINLKPEDLPAAEADANGSALHIVHGIEAIVDEVLRLGAAGVVVQGLLPRASKFPAREELLWGQGNHYWKAIEEVNRKLRTEVVARDRVTYADCSANFTEGGRIKHMPDGLHPGASGAPLFIDCLRAAADQCLLRRRGEKKATD
eukprot:Hpha_TRINITY_DN9836_c0_g1::TRINITY_DN9836_c0_g1_i1::g.81436::m.81436